MLGLAPSMHLEAAAKLTYSQFSAVVTVDDGSGSLTETTITESSAGLTLSGSFCYDIDGMSLGPEIQYPIYFSDKFKDVSTIYFLAFVGFHF
ncbi:MAG: hypothetical protein R3B45_06825 [Bdellovibrionota bacterium]